MIISKEYSKNDLDNYSKLHGYCYKVITTNNEIYYYEIKKINNIAYINYENPDYLEAVIEEFRKAYEYVNIFKSYDNSFYAEFEPVHTFKLPIDIIQVSEMLINEDRVKKLESIIDPDNIHLSVKIVNDEYVLYGDHNLLYTLKLIGERMVNVFINTTLDETIVEFLNQFIYVLKENNISSISKCVEYDEETYNNEASNYLALFNTL